MKQFLEKLNNIVRKNFKESYDYRYYLLDGENLILNKEKNNKSRESFEEFKEEYKVGIPGQISLRSYRDINTNEIIGYVAEEKIPDTKANEEIKKIYLEAYEEIISLLKIKDRECFEFYLDAEVFDACCLELHFYPCRIRALIKLYERYNSEEDFKKYLQKIIS